MKVGKSPAEDVARVRAVRETIGADCELMVDADMGWTLPEAARRAHALEQFDLAGIEEPLPPHDVSGHAALQRQTLVPLAAGETLFSPSGFIFFRSEAIRIPQPDVIRLGVTGWLQVAAMAEACALPLAPHFIPEIHVHLACAYHAPEHRVPRALRPAARDPLAIRDGVAKPPDVPGHGMMFSLEVLEPHRVGSARELHLKGAHA